MIAILICWIYIFTTSMLAGFLFRCLLKLYIPVSTPYNFVLLSISGLACISAIICVLGFFMPTGEAMNLILLIIEIAGCIFFRQELKDMLSYSRSVIIQIKPFQWIIFIVLIANVVIMNVLSVHTDSDPGLYHAQMIQWIEKYPTIKGLGNLFANYAFNSCTFNLAAFYSFTWLHNFPYYTINAYLILILIIWLSSFINQRNAITITASLIIPFIYFYFRGDMSLPYPDITVCCTELFILFIFYSYLKKNDLKNFNYDIAVIILLAITVISMKLSALMFIIIPLIIFFISHSSSKKSILIFTLSTSILILAPWLIRNYLLSGYILFPIPGLDLFNPDWKLPAEEVKISHSWIISHARTRVQEDTFSLSFSQWFPIWRSAYSRTDILLLLFAVAGLLTKVIISFFKKKEDKMIWMYIFLLTAIIYWFESAPAFRFGIAVIAFSAFVVFSESISLTSINPKLLIISVYILLTLSAIYFSLWPAGLIKSGQVTIRKHLINPEMKYKPIRCIYKQMKGFTVAMPYQNKRCWNEPVPCTPRLYNTLEMRGNKIEDGFRIAPGGTVENSVIMKY